MELGWAVRCRHYSEPALVASLLDQQVASVACGDASSFAVTEQVLCLVRHLAGVPARTHKRIVGLTGCLAGQCCSALMIHDGGG